MQERPHSKRCGASSVHLRLKTGEKKDECGAGWLQEVVATHLECWVVGKQRERSRSQGYL